MNLTRRGLFGAGALMGLASLALQSKPAFAWSSWTNASAPVLYSMHMGDCLHEDLTQIAYARVLRNHADDSEQYASLLNPWAGEVQDDARYATIAGDTVDVGEGGAFVDADDLATHLYRENLAYLRIGSYWNDAAANTLADYAISCFNADSIPKFSGSSHYEGVWDVGQHLLETNQALHDENALVQFSANDRGSFMHGMLSSTADHSGFLTQSDVKRFVMQWLGVAYEYARTGEVMMTHDVTSSQAEKIFRGLIDTYGQLDETAHDMHVSLQVGSDEASVKLSRRELRLRALGMICHTIEDLWCPAHTVRTFHDGSITQGSILAFCNYKKQHGNKMPMFGHHTPFDIYALSDTENSTNWREALTRGDTTHKGSETLTNALDPGMDCLDDAHARFNTLGMNDAIGCVTHLLECLYQGTAWDDGVCTWIDTEVMPTFFDESGQSLICDAGRYSLHTPTYLIAPIQSLGWAYRKAGLSENYDELLDAAKAFNDWQRGTHLFFSGTYNTDQSKYVESGYEGDSIWDDSEGDNRLVNLVDKLHEGYSSLSSDEQRVLLARIGCNCCHDMVSAIDTVEGILQEFSIDLRGALRTDSEGAVQKLDEARTFFASGVFGTNEEDRHFVAPRMALESFATLEDGSFLIAVRNMDSLETSIMVAPEGTQGTEMLANGIANLTIAYTLQTEFDDDLDYRYIVSEIDCSTMEENTYLDTGTVKSVSVERKSLELDINGFGDSKMPIGDGLAGLPQEGTYICACYSYDGKALELIHYDELDDPGELMQVTYPVAKVNGSNVWLLTNDGATEDGHRNYLVIDYGRADVYTVPQEGQEITVYYHDEAYGETADVDESALAAASFAAGSEGLYAQAADDELTDSATPGYLELGDDAGKLDYGNEVFHIANVIIGPDEKPVIPSVEIENPPEPEPEPEPEPKPKPEPTPDPTPKPDNSPIPGTGDSFASMDGWLAATVVAGGAVAAYSSHHMAAEDPEE